MHRQNKLNIGQQYFIRRSCVHHLGDHAPTEIPGRQPNYTIWCRVADFAAHVLRTIRFSFCRLPHRKTEGSAFLCAPRCGYLTDHRSRPNEHCADLKD